MSEVIEQTARVLGDPFWIFCSVVRWPMLPMVNHRDRRRQGRSVAVFNRRRTGKDERHQINQDPQADQRSGDECK
jgi:hypothetical protein